MIGIIMATELEAHPFIEAGHSRGKEHSFPVFYNEECTLIISGIGKANAAMAVTLGKLSLGITTFVNLGAAGALKEGFVIGDVCHVDRVCDCDRPGVIDRAPRFLKPAVLDGFSGTALATRDRATVSVEERSDLAALADLADMEGAGFVQACSRFDCTGIIIKIVTDVPGHGDGDIIANVTATREALYGYFTREILPALNRR